MSGRRSSGASGCFLTIDRASGILVTDMTHLARRWLGPIGALVVVLLFFALGRSPIGGIVPGDWRSAGYVTILLLALIASCVPGAPVPMPPLLFFAGQALDPATVAVGAMAGMVACAPGGFCEGG